MNANARRGAVIGLAVLIVAGIVAAIVWGRSAGGDTADAGSHALTMVTGVIGSEKQPFFSDAAVKKEFAKNGLDVEVTTAGSRAIATTVDLTGVDFAFPSSAPAAIKLQQKTGAKTVYAPFYSPMAIASFTPIVALLAKEGIAKQGPNGTWLFDMGAYLQKTVDATDPLRWNQIPGNTSYATNKNVLLSSTDVRSSNSAGMYLAIASYVANGDNVVSSDPEQARIIDRLAKLFLDQGFSASSSEDPWQDFLSQGVGSKPILMIYEAQFLGQEVTDHDTGTTAVTDDMVLMYPTPTVFSKHTVVPLTASGDKVGRLLMTDPKLIELAARYGFRTNDPSAFATALKAHGVAAPALPVDVIDPPSYERLEALIDDISDRYPGGAKSSPTPTPNP